MVAQMPDVVLHQETEGDGAIRPIPGSGERLRRRHGNDVGQVTVIGRPQGDGIAEGHLGVLLARDPIILVVSLKNDGRLVATDDESAVVVARRIHQMAEDLPGAPAAVARPFGGARFVNVVKQVKGVADGAV